MKAPLALEIYLNKLEKSLGPITVSEKAEIITEIKSHVMEALDRDPQQSIDKVLASLGEPETVANRYLLERGLKPNKPPKHPIVRWLVIGFLGTFGMVLVFSLILAFMFSPIMEIDGETGRVKFLGGVVDIKGGGADWDEDIGKLSFKADIDLDGVGRKTIAEGTKNITSEKITNFKIKFGNGTVKINKSTDDEIKWRCKVRKELTHDNIVVDNGTFLLNIFHSGNVKCEISVPDKLKVDVSGHNGKIELEEPSFPVEASLHNGKVRIDPNNKLKYRFDLNVHNGKIDDFVSFDNPDAIVIKASIHNGTIENG